MTDAQLSVLLYQYATRLEKMVESAELILPDEAKQERRQINIFDPRTPHFYKQAEALDELRAFAQELKQDSELLELTARKEATEKR